MENASKALLIAASILIAIILIAFAVTTINSTSGTTDSVEQTMNAAEVTMFNNKFTPYLGTNKSITEAKALINIVIAHNALQKTETEKVRLQIAPIGFTRQGGYDPTMFINEVSKIKSNNITIRIGQWRDGYIKQIFIEEQL